MANAGCGDRAELDTSHKQVVHLVRLTEAVSHAVARIVAHAHRAHFMDNAAADRNGNLVVVRQLEHIRVHACKDLAEGMLHMPQVIQFSAPVADEKEE